MLGRHNEPGDSSFLSGFMSFSEIYNNYPLGWKICDHRLHNSFCLAVGELGGLMLLVLVLLSVGLSTDCFVYLDVFSLYIQC